MRRFVFTLATMLPLGAAVLPAATVLGTLAGMPARAQSDGTPEHGCARLTRTWRLAADQSSAEARDNLRRLGAGR